MCTNASEVAARTPTDQTRQQPQLWAKPRFNELRLGFEVTLYSGYR
jgi:coenzyme PQQ precursor peptide PqqA